MKRREAAELGARELGVLRDLDRVRALTGRQLERLHFASLATSNARGSARRRTMQRLVEVQLVTTLSRRIGGERAGSAGLVYVLDSRGRAYLHTADGQRQRRPWSVGWLFLQHTLDVAEIYVRLREREREGQLKLGHFVAEPASWHQTNGWTVKPDAWLVYETKQWEQHRWLEVDRGTESLPTLERKLRSYAAFGAAGLPGPLGVVPRVLVTLPSDARLASVQQLIAALPEPADRMLEATLFEDAFHARAPPA
jgi:hypothetical protein